MGVPALALTPDAIIVGVGSTRARAPAYLFGWDRSGKLQVEHRVRGTMAPLAARRDGEVHLFWPGADDLSAVQTVRIGRTRVESHHVSSSFQRPISARPTPQGWLVRVMAQASCMGKGSVGIAYASDESGVIGRYTTKGWFAPFPPSRWLPTVERW